MGKKTHFHIVTIFPEAIEPYTKSSIIGRALKNKLVKISWYNPKDYTDVKKRVDSKPYGGGPGMVLGAIPYLRAYKDAKGRKKSVKTVFFSVGGNKLNKKQIVSYGAFDHIILIAGHYEGVDERVVLATKADKISVGDYTLTGGELPSLIFLDCLSREIEGVLGNPCSIEESRINSHKVYTRPEELTWGKKKYKVPQVLLNGNHKEIEDWREKN